MISSIEAYADMTSASKELVSPLSKLHAPSDIAEGTAEVNLLISIL